MLRLDALALGHAPPDDINVLGTSRSGAEPIALEWDAPTGALTVSQLFHTTMRAPGNLGIIPRTQAENGEPLHALVVPSHEVPSGIVLPARPIGVVIAGWGDLSEAKRIILEAAERVRGPRSYA